MISNQNRFLSNRTLILCLVLVLSSLFTACGGKVTSQASPQVEIVERSNAPKLVVQLDFNSFENDLGAATKIWLENFQPKLDTPLAENKSFENRAGGEPYKVSVNWPAKTKFIMVYVEFPNGNSAVFTYVLNKDGSLTLDSTAI